MFWKQCQEEPKLSSSLRRVSPEPQNPDWGWQLDGRGIPGIWLPGGQLWW